MIAQVVLSNIPIDLYYQDVAYFKIFKKKVYNLLPESIQRM